VRAEKINRYGIAYGAGRWVQVGMGGLVRTSADAVTWTCQAPGLTGRLYDVAYGANVFVAVGDRQVGVAGFILWSSDGVTWNEGPTHTDTLLRVTYVDNQFVALGGRGSLWTSSDGKSWEARTTGSTVTLRGLGSDGTTWLAVGNGGTLLESTDQGQSWAAIPLTTTENLTDVLHHSGRWTIVGYGGTVVRRADGETAWAEQVLDAGYDLYTVATDGSLLVVGGSHTSNEGKGLVLTSTDGAGWTTAHTSSQGNAGVRRVLYANGQFVASAERGETLSSNDGSAWSTQVDETYPLARSLEYANGIFMGAGGGGEVATSADGISWTKHSTGLSFASAAAWGGNVWVAVGLNQIVWSVDGASWTAATFTAGAPSSLQGVAYGNGLFMAVGWSGEMWTSADGKTWTPGVSGTTSNLFDVAYEGSRWVTVGSNWRWSDDDGATWTQAAGVPGSGLTRVIAHNGGFVGVGSNGLIVSMVANASSVTVLQAAGHTFSDVLSGTGGVLFLSYFEAESRLSYAADGALNSLALEVLPFNDQLNSLAFGQGRLVVGSGDVLVTSP